MDTSSSPHTLNFIGVFSESKRIINAHSRHFLALSVLFLLPLSFSLIIFPTIHSLLSQPNSIFNHPPLPRLELDSINLQTRYPLQLDSVKLLSTLYPLELDSINLLNGYHFEPDSIKPAIFPVFYTLFALLLFLYAFATISYSTFHGFYGRPVKIVATLKSLLTSFFPLCATVIVSLVVVAVIVFLFVFLGGLIFKGLELIGVGIGFDSRGFSWIVALVVFMVGLTLVYLHVVWVLAPVVVVVESKWGYEALRRSAYLIRGMRSVALTLMVFFGSSIWFLTWACSRSVVNFRVVWGFESMVFVFETVISSGLVTLLMLHSMAAIAVLYMYCKAVRGELAFEIAEEFGSNYVSLPFDEEKVPHVVSVVYG